MLNQDDPEVVAAGAPAYLLMLDALILTYPENERFLLAGAQLYGAYAGVFAQDEEQAKTMANKNSKSPQRYVAIRGGNQRTERKWRRHGNATHGVFTGSRKLQPYLLTGSLDH
jgi:hypothetical protein